MQDKKHTHVPSRKIVVGVRHNFVNDAISGNRENTGARLFRVAARAARVLWEASNTLGERPISLARFWPGPELKYQ